MTSNFVQVVTLGLLLSGTVVVNALTELYVMFKYLRPQEPNGNGLAVSMRGQLYSQRKRQIEELNVTGSVKRKERFRT